MILLEGFDVTIFDQNNGVKDSRFSSAKIMTPLYFPKILFFFYACIYQFFVYPTRVILHVSTLKGVVLVIPSLLFRRNISVFLHSGTLIDRNLPRILVKFLVALSEQFDDLFVVSDVQIDQLALSGHSLRNTIKIFPVLSNTGIVISPKPFPKVSVQPLFIACGHETRIYNFEFAVNLLAEFTNASVHLYLYGSPCDPGYLDELFCLAKNKNLFVFRDQPKKQFLTALQSASVFIRANYVDSFGVSVFDAVSLGVPTVASDVCQRAAGSACFSSGNYTDFLSKVKVCLSNSMPLATDSSIVFNSRNAIESILRYDKNRHKKQSLFAFNYFF